MNNCRRCQSPDAPMVYIADAPLRWPFPLCGFCQQVWERRGIPLSPFSTAPEGAGIRPSAGVGSQPAPSGVAEHTVTPESASV